MARDMCIIIMIVRNSQVSCEVVHNYHSCCLYNRSAPDFIDSGIFCYTAWHSYCVCMNECTHYIIA